MVAVIPARGGSKGIPGKNIRPFLGRPLLYWVCKAANDCGAIEAAYVATDDEAIAETVRGLGLPKLRVIARDPATATDTASTESLLLDFAGRVPFDELALLQATSPLLTPADLDAGAVLMQQGFDSVLSAVRQRRFLWRADEGGEATALNYDPRQRPRRQEFEGQLVENGAFYMMTRALLLREECRLGGRIGVVEMPEDTYIELDSPADWQAAEALLAARQRAARGPLEARMRALRCVASDIDGCLTDSGMYYSEHGDELKKFNTRDGKGFELLRNAGLLTMLITNEDRELNQRRAEKMRIDAIRQGAANKVAAIAELCAQHGLDWEGIAFLGDDQADVALLRRVGVSACPSDAAPQVRQVCDIVLDAPGGGGALRELAERILQARGAG